MISRQFDVSADRSSNESLWSVPGDELTVRAKLIAAIADTMAAQGLSQVKAAKLCLTDQPTLSKVLRGRTQSVTLDKLMGWLLALGRSIEIRVAPMDQGQRVQLTAVVDD